MCAGLETHKLVNEIKGEHSHNLCVGTMRGAKHIPKDVERALHKLRRLSNAAKHLPQRWHGSPEEREKGLQHTKDPGVR